MSICLYGGPEGRLTSHLFFTPVKIVKKMRLAAFTLAVTHTLPACQLPCQADQFFAGFARNALEHKVLRIDTETTCQLNLSSICLVFSDSESRKKFRDTKFAKKRSRTTTQGRLKICRSALLTDNKQAKATTASLLSSFACLRHEHSSC